MFVIIPLQPLIDNSTTTDSNEKTFQDFLQMLQNFSKNIPLFYMHNDVCSIFKYSATLDAITANRLRC